jgi:hypothetical protein
VSKTIAYFSGILDKSLDTEDFVFILFIISGKVGFPILVEYEIHGSEPISQEEKGFDYLSVFHYARAIKSEIYIFLIPQVAKAMILQFFVLLALDVNGDFYGGILGIEGMEHFEGFLHDSHGCWLQLVEAS